MEDCEKHREVFYKELDNYYFGKNKKKPWYQKDVDEVIQNLTEAKASGSKKTQNQYYVLRKYDLLQVGG